MWCWLFHQKYRCQSPELLAQMRAIWSDYPKCMWCRR